MSTSVEEFLKQNKKVSSHNSSVKEPFKLIVQVIYLMIVFVPFIVWATLANLFARRKSVRDKVVLITGAGHGLGRSLALQFAKLGSKVACADVNVTNNEETVRLIKLISPTAIAIAYKCDVAIEGDIEYLAKCICKDMGEVDIIVHNAGIVSDTTITEFKTSFLDKMLDVNLKSHFLIIREFLPKMMKRNSGHYVAMCSLAGLNGLANAAVYSATKHGVMGLMDSLHDELRQKTGNKIVTTCICPYFISTNDHLSKNWDLRLPELSVQRVSNDTIDAILKNKRMVGIPSALFNVSLYKRSLPDNLHNMIRDIFYARLTPNYHPDYVRSTQHIKSLKV